MYIKINNLISFIVKTIILFGFIYEFVPAFMPSSFFSSRKVCFVIALAYFILKGYSFKCFFKSKYYRRLGYLTFFCVMYSLLLLQVNSGRGEPIIVWYVFFLLYAIIGPFLFAGLFDWNIERLIMSIAVVTAFQAVWSILTYYIFDFRIINSMLFVVDENENIDFLQMSRLRSIGAAGSALSVYLALSSFSYLFFILRRKKIVLNNILLLVSLFATILAGTTGMLIFVISIPVALFMVTKNRKSGIISAFIIIVSLLTLFNFSSSFFNEDQYERLTSKFISLYENKQDDATISALTKEQEVSGISFTTIIGTGYSRGKLSSGEICDHDGGFYRSYFGIGLIMAIVFYSLLFLSMIQLTEKIPRGLRPLFLAYIVICMGIEFKEPFVMFNVPVFLFTSYYLYGKIEVNQYFA